ncbi:MAG: GNAT family N-acetyltransferase [Acidothermus sp.]|nr:GNAT family N-acetyltransferase [Acidothermus sp.]MCL6538335.1 GNAT family N-acetyltransferase [Acidothermus sp.]
MPAPRARVREYRLQDLPALRRICVLTGDAGQDATGLFGTDDLLPDLFLAPYVEYAPECGFVLDSAGEPVGYVVGVPDTGEFVAWYRATWIPRLESKYPKPTDPGTLEADLIAGHYAPERMLRPELADFPAHLHIDILPDHQGRGWGRALMSTEFDALRERGARGVHVAVSTRNVRAHGFYEKLGFRRISESENGAVAYLGYSFR